MQTTIKHIVTSFVNLRRTQGLTQEYVRDNWHVDVSNIENGRNYPGLTNYLKLCKGYQISGGWLLILSEMVDDQQLSIDEMEYIVDNWDQFDEYAHFLSDGFTRITKAKFYKK